MNTPPSSARETPPGRSALLIRQGEVLCAIPLERVGEVMRPLPIEPVGDPAPFVKGLARVRGEAVAVLDLAGLLGQVRAGSPSRWVTLQEGGRTTALAVDEVLGVRALPEARAGGEVPPILEASALEHVARLDARLVLVLAQLGAVAPNETPGGGPGGAPGGSPGGTPARTPEAAPEGGGRGATR